ACWTDGDAGGRSGGGVWFMSPGLRLSLLLLIAGCASQMLVVPDKDWQIVPAPQRAALDRQHEAKVTAARAELKFATAGLAQAQRPAASARTAQTAPASTTPNADGDDEVWTAAMHDHDQARVSARARVEEAKATWQRTRLTWRQLQVDAANARLDMLVCDRELTRARAIDHALPGTEHYDSA